MFLLPFFAVAVLLMLALVADNSSAQLQTMYQIQLTAQNSAVLLLYPDILQSIYATEGSRPIPKPPFSVNQVNVWCEVLVQSKDSCPACCITNLESDPRTELCWPGCDSLCPVVHYQGRQGGSSELKAATLMV